MKQSPTKTYGKLELKRERKHDFYAITAQPHVMIRLKNIFPPD